MRKSSLARLYYIDREIASGKYPNARYLADHYAYKLGSATIYRDIEFMRYSLDAPIEYDAEHRGWYYAEKSFRLPARYAAANDMAALGMAKSLLALYHNTPLYESAKRLLDDITAPLGNDDIDDAKDSGAVPWYEKRIAVPPVASVAVDQQTWETLTSALRENREVTFEYTGLRDTEAHTRLVRPYQLLFDTGAWYLYGFSEERQAVRLFSLSRIKNICLTNETFTLPEDFDYAAANTGYFGVFAGEKRYFRIRFSNAAAAEIEERQWAADQKIEKAEDGDCFILGFSSAQYEKVLRWVLSFGSSASPLEPCQLVEDWEWHIDELYAGIHNLENKKGA